MICGEGESYGRSDSEAYLLTAVLSCSSCSSGQEVDRAGGGGAAGVRDEAAGRTGGDGQRQEAEGGPGHPLPGPGYVRHPQTHDSQQHRRPAVSAP